MFYWFCMFMGPRILSVVGGVYWWLLSLGKQEN